MMTESLDTTVRVALYDEFIHTGRCPSAARLSELAGVPSADVRASLERLATSKALVLQPESREVLMANPLCAVPTPYAVRSQEKLFFGSCIWDALGIAAMLQTPATVETSCACCGEAVQLHIDGSVRASRAALIHFGLPAKRWWENIVFT